MGTPPDFQDYGCVRDDEWMTRHGVAVIVDEVKDRGATWLRVTVEGDRFYVDGWLERPEEEAPYVIMSTVARC